MNYPERQLILLLCGFDSLELSNNLEEDFYFSHAVKKKDQPKAWWLGCKFSYFVSDFLIFELLAALRCYLQNLRHTCTHCLLNRARTSTHFAAVAACHILAGIQNERF